MDATVVGSGLAVLAFGSTKTNLCVTLAWRCSIAGQVWLDSKQARIEKRTP